MIQVNLANIQSFVTANYEAELAARVRDAHDKLQLGTGAGNDYIGWVRLPENYDKEEFARIKAAAKKIQSDSKALVVIGIGGSYLGARGVIECLCSANYNLKKKNTPNIYFAGNGLSSDQMSEVVELLGDDDFSINVISKSGTTTEPAVAFRFFRKLLEDKYGKEEAAKRIYATTDRARGALKSLADEAGYESFVEELVNAECAELHGFEEQPVYEGCMPIEKLAKRGKETMRFGPLKPVGLRDPNTGHRPWAAVQLRRENAEGTMFNIVGFQTNLKVGE